MHRKDGLPKKNAYTPERNRKISTALKGRVRSKEHARNISKAKKGIKHSAELREKRSALYKELYAKGRIKIQVMSGEKNPNWKGGITNKDHSLRTSAAFIEWRKKVYERDGYKCQKCGDDRGGNLHPHHVKLWKFYPELRFEVSNGLTLCKKCHINIHKGKRYAETLH